MRHFDLSPLYRSTIGFDQLFSMLDQASVNEAGTSYPPYNIERTGETNYRISVAVAGFTPDHLTIEAKDNILTVRGEKKEQSSEKTSEVLYQGIASRTFERHFQLAEHVQVTGALLEHGLLHIDLIREIPEAKKPRLIPIQAEKKASLEGKVEAA